MNTYQRENILIKHKYILLTSVLFATITITTLLYFKQSRKHKEFTDTFTHTPQESDTKKDTDTHIVRPKTYVLKKKALTKERKFDKTVDVHKGNTHTFSDEIQPQHISISITNKADEMLSEEIVHRVINHQFSLYDVHTAQNESMQIELRDFDDTQLKEALVRVYNIQRSIYHRKLDTKDVQEYKEACYILYRYILYDSFDYTLSEKCFDEDTFHNIRAYMFNKYTLYRQAAHTFLSTIILNVQNVYSLEKQFKDTFNEELCMFTQHIRDAFRVISVSTYCKLDTSRIILNCSMYNTELSDTHNAHRIILTFPSVTNIHIQNKYSHDEYICLNMAHMTKVNSYVIFHQYIVNKNVIHIPEHISLRQYILLYFGTYSNGTQHGYRALTTVHPAQAVHINDMRTIKVSFMYDHNVSLEFLETCGVVYVGSNVLRLENSYGFSNTSKLLNDNNTLSYIQDMHTQTGITLAFQRPEISKHDDYRYTRQFFIYTSTLYTNEQKEYDEYNALFPIPIGSVIVKQCLEIIDAYFYLLFHQPEILYEHSERAKVNVLHKDICILIDINDDNIYGKTADYIRHMFAHSIEYALSLIEQHKEDLIDKVTKESFTQAYKQHIRNIMAYINELRVHIILPDHSSNTVRAQSNVVVYEYLARTHVLLHSKLTEIQQRAKFIDPSLVTDVVSALIFNRDLSIRNMQKAFSFYSDEGRLVQKVNNHIIDTMHTNVKKCLLYMKYKLHNENYNGRENNEELIVKLPVCNIMSATHNIDIESTQIYKYIQDFNMNIQYDKLTDATNVLKHHITRIHLIEDAMSLMSSLKGPIHIALHDLHIQCTDKEFNVLLAYNEKVLLNV